MKKLILFLMLFVTAWSNAFAVVEITVDGIIYLVKNDEEGTVSCFGLVDKDAVRDVTIPGTVTYNGTEYTVNSIYYYAFKDSKITSVVIPNTVKDINSYAFQYCSLESVVIPNSVTRIGMRAFDGCSKLTSITIPNSVTSMGVGVFWDCTSLSSITLSNRIKSIEEDTFFGCHELSSVTIPNSVEYINREAFYWCKKLTSITIPSSVKNISNSVFKGCQSLSYIKLEHESSDIKFEKLWLNGTDDKTKIIVNCCLNVDLYEDNHEIIRINHDWKDIYDEEQYTWTHHCQRNAEHDIQRKQLCFMATDDNSQIQWGQTTYDKVYDLEYTLNWDDTWHELVPGEPVTMRDGDKIWIRGTATRDYTLGGFNWLNGRFEASGSIMSMIDGIGETTVIPYENCFFQLFNQFGGLVKAPALPATTLKKGCYKNMFSGCTNLEEAPVLPATTLAEDCYKNMFDRCRTLHTVPALPAETLVKGCYYSMFEDCGDLRSLTINATDVSAEDCLERWVYNLNGGSGIVHITDALALQNADLHLSNNWRADKYGVHANEDPDNAGDYYATFYDSQSEYCVKEGTKAYTGIVDGDVLNMTAEADNIIPAGEGVLLKGNTADVILTLSDTEKVQTAGNALTGSDSNTTAPANSYIFTYAQNGLGFYKYTAGKPLTAHKAYLMYNNAAGAKGFRIAFDGMDGGVTGIENLTPALSKGEGAYYNLSGLRFSRMQKGINIVNRKKMVIK